MKKIITFALKFLFGIIAFYLFLAFIVIPIAAPLVVQSQGSKILGHPVRVRAVHFNPFLWRVNIYEFKIIDNEERTMVGFDRLGIDVSFIRLFAKEYRVESIELDGLLVNAVLMADGKIDLLELVPANPPATSVKAAPVPPAPAPAREGTGVPPASVRASQPLPLVIVDKIALWNGNVSFNDVSVKPTFSVALSGMECDVTGVSTRPDCRVKVVFKTRLDEKGVISVEALCMPFSRPLQLETDFALNDYALQVVSPYTGKYTGRMVSDGKLDLKMAYRISENKLTASHKLMVQKFGFGDKVESKDALNLPFGLAIALLEDPQGRIIINLPVTGDMSSPKFHYFHLIGEVARNFILKLVTKPFTFLASVLGSETGTEEMGYTRFAPGSAMLTDEEKGKLDLIIRGLKERPRLLLEINGSYDPEVDWRAVRKEALEKDYTELRKNSEREDRQLYQTLYVPQFGLSSYHKLMKAYKLPDGSYDFAKINDEAKRLLIEKGSADKIFLETLAQSRATVIYDYFIARGFDAKRVSIGKSRSVQASMGFVPLELTLTVFEDK